MTCRSATSCSASSWQTSPSRVAAPGNPRSITSNRARVSRNPAQTASDDPRRPWPFPNWRRPPDTDSRSDHCARKASARARSSAGIGPAGAPADPPASGFPPGSVGSSGMPPRKSRCPRETLDELKDASFADASLIRAVRIPSETA